eukprot:scaffold195977_cov51-Prasinocladus_malaysianus.AAC.1
MLRNVTMAREMAAYPPPHVAVAESDSSEKDSASSEDLMAERMATSGQSGEDADGSKTAPTHPQHHAAAVAQKTARQTEAREKELAARSDDMWPQRLANRQPGPPEQWPQEGGPPQIPTFEAMYHECIRRAATLRQR